MLWAWMLSYSRSLEHEHKRNYGLGIDALFDVRSWNTKVEHGLGMDALLPYALRTGTELCFGHGHGCSPNRTH